MATEAKRRANIAYNKRQDAIMLRPSKALGAQIRAAASISGQSLQNYCLEAIRTRMILEGAAPQDEQEG